jgi:hypothetical protein
MPYRIIVRRGSETVTIDSKLRFVQDINFEIREVPDAPARAVSLREGILTGKMGM